MTLNHVTLQLRFCKTKQKVRFINSTQGILFNMAQTYQIQVVGFKGERKTIDVANSEADFQKTTILVFRKKLLEKFPELKGRLIYIALSLIT